jgi:hypothetical protein
MERLNGKTALVTGAGVIMTGMTEGDDQLIERSAHETPWVAE